MRLSWTLTITALWSSTYAAQGARKDETKNVAIIGAGAAGASAAYHLQKYALQEDLPINITLFEKSPLIGGRTLTIDAFGLPQYPIELGASIFVKINHIMYGATQEFNLPLGSLNENQPGDIIGIWDGEKFVYESAAGESSWWETARMVYKYGTSPYWAMRLMKDTMDKFLRLYEEPFFPFRSLTQRCFELGLTRITGMTGEQLLDENKINPQFSRDIVQAATRVNYASNLGYVHGLEAMVSIATDGAVAVQGGNWQIFDRMVTTSGAAFYPNTSVASISLAKGASAHAPKYVVSTKSAASKTASESFPIAFDNLIIASPWQFSSIKADRDVIRHKIDEIPYTKLHVTVFTSPFKLRAGYFGLPAGSKAPSTVYTTLHAHDESKAGPDGVGRAGFYSISTLKTAINPKTLRLEYVYKIFSPAEITPEFLSDILGADIPSTFTSRDDRLKASGVEPISWYHPHWFYSYPIELPRVTFQDPILGNGLYYTSGIESFISTMETSALMGKNVARLIVDDFAGINRGQLFAEDEPIIGNKDDFFESMENEFFGGITMDGPGEL